MKKEYLLIIALFVGLTATGCKPKNQEQGVTTGDIKTPETKEGLPPKQTANSAAQILAKPEIPILCYHRIAEGKKGDYAVSPATFSGHMKILADSGYHTITPGDLYQYLVYNQALPERPILITFDDSRIEHTEIAAPVLEKFGFRGVFFIMTITYGKKNYMTTEQLAKLAKAGHTIGLHTWDHTMVTKFADSTDWKKQIIAPKAKLEEIVGQPVEYFAYPNGVFNAKAAQGLNPYFKLSFILTSRRDTINPLQTVRRMIVPDWSDQGLIKSIKRTFKC